jgi:hypothetical protein
MPQCQFPVFCYFFVLEKLHRKYSQNWTKQKPNLLYLPKLCEDRRWDGGEPGASHTIGWRSLAPDRATGWWGHLAHLLTLPFRLYIPLNGKNLKDRSLFLETYCKPPPSSSWDWEDPRALPGTLPEAFSTTMVTSVVMCELSTLEYGSIALARWSSSPPCASCLDLVSCPTWSRSSFCNSTYCVCWDPMSIATMLSWCAEYYLFYLYVIYDLACSPLLVDILAE